MNKRESRGKDFERAQLFTIEAISAYALTIQTILSSREFIDVVEKSKPPAEWGSHYNRFTPSLCILIMLWLESLLNGLMALDKTSESNLFKSIYSDISSDNIVQKMAKILRCLQLPEHKIKVIVDDLNQAEDIRNEFVHPLHYKEEFTQHEKLINSLRLQKYIPIKPSGTAGFMGSDLYWFGVFRFILDKTDCAIKELDKKLKEKKLTGMIGTMFPEFFLFVSEVKSHIKTIKLE